MNGTVFAGAITVFVFPLSSLTGRTVEKLNQDYIMTCVCIVHSTSSVQIAFIKLPLT